VKEDAKAHIDVKKKGRALAENIKESRHLEAERETGRTPQYCTSALKRPTKNERRKIRCKRGRGRKKNEERARKRKLPERRRTKQRD